jgi:hypothetical protein
MGGVGHSDFIGGTSTAFMISIRLLSKFIETLRSLKLGRKFLMHRIEKTGSA